jgi:hypothetical protein
MGGGPVAARAHPVMVAQRTLERYAGRYQERTIALREGRLHYRRGGSPESLLIPMAQDLFELETDPTLRVHFVGAGAAQARKLVEVSTDGIIDESVRTR